jgi:predicted deacylase
MKPDLLAPEHTSPGSRRCVRLPITTSLGGAQVSLWVHVVRGARPGPTLALLSAQHGDEWFGTEFQRQLLDQLNPQTLRGTVLAVPVANPPALEIGKRTAPDESGGLDLNRSYPGRTTQVTDRLAAAITSEVLSQADALLDFHQGDWGITWSSVGYPVDLPDPAVVARSEAMAKAFGHACLHRTELMTGPKGGGSACGYAGANFGVPSLAVSLGGTGFGAEVEAGWAADAVAGIRGVMSSLGMLAEAVPAAPRRLTFSRSWNLRPRCGGLLIPVIGVNRLLTEVKAGELLGRVVSPYTFEVWEELVAPTDGLLICVARQYPVQPGSWSFSAADLTAPDSVWDWEAAA